MAMAVDAAPLPSTLEPGHAHTLNGHPFASTIVSDGAGPAEETALPVVDRALLLACYHKQQRMDVNRSPLRQQVLQRAFVQTLKTATLAQKAQAARTRRSAGGGRSSPLATTTIPTAAGAEYVHHFRMSAPRSVDSRKRLSSEREEQEVDEEEEAAAGSDSALPSASKLLKIQHQRLPF